MSDNARKLDELITECRFQDLKKEIAAAKGRTDALESEIAELRAIRQTCCNEIADLKEKLETSQSLVDMDQKDYRRFVATDSLLRTANAERERYRSELETIASQWTSEQHEEFKGEGWDLETVAEAYELTIIRARRVIGHKD